MSDDCFYQSAPIEHNGRQQPWLLTLIETERQEVTRLEIEVFEIVTELLLSSLIIGIASPYLEFNNILLPKVVDDYVHTFAVAGLSLDVVVTDAVDDGTKIGEEDLTTILFEELVVLVHREGLVDVCDELLEKTRHVDDAVMDELVLVEHTLLEGHTSL